MAVRAADGGARLLLSIRCGEVRESLSVLAARISRVPALGGISEEELQLYRAEAEIAEAVTAGLRALSAGGCSRRGLLLKLRRRGVSAEAAGVAVAELAARRLLCEEESALRAAEVCLAKLWGNRRIMMELRAKGYEGEALEAAEALLRREDGSARCARLIRKRRLYPQSEEMLPKTVAALMRYGYTRGEIARALGRMTKE